jgi:NTP pyrophosphatase (non-canonical NTP hydrolase)
MNINELNAHIIDWAKERELDTKGTVEAQAIKTVEELSELIKAICKDKKEDIIDSIGDVYVTLVIGNMLDKQFDLEATYNDAVYYSGLAEITKVNTFIDLGDNISQVLTVLYSNFTLYKTLHSLLITATMYDLDFVECVESAYNTIKNRHGVIKDGMYVKDEDLASGAAQKATPDFTKEIVKKIGHESVKSFFDGFTNA